MAKGDALSPNRTWKPHKMVKALILRTAGTNCDLETEFAFQRNGASADRLHINRIMENPRILSDYQILAIPGGFSHGDYISAGKILANQILHRIRDSLLEFTTSDKLIIGICNGFQVLVKTGLLPGPSEQGKTVFRQDATLMNNDSGNFTCQWTDLIVNNAGKAGDMDPFTRGMPERISLPIAHGEGKFYADDAVIDRLVKTDRVAFKYASNPNGSLADIAGINDISGRILGLMPHPERFCIQEQSPMKGLYPEPYGNRIFSNMVSYFR